MSESTCSTMPTLGIKRFDISGKPHSNDKSVWLVVDESLDHPDSSKMEEVYSILHVEKPSIFPLQVVKPTEWKPNTLVSYLLKDTIHPECTYLKKVKYSLKAHLNHIRPDHRLVVVSTTSQIEEFREYLFDILMYVRNENFEMTETSPFIIPKDVILAIDEIILVRPIGE